ncbi:MAG TPA: hypothetical protein VJA40_00890 [archaeon]|nr:hypothetical protein [archaeon]
MASEKSLLLVLAAGATALILLTAAVSQLPRDQASIELELLASAKNACWPSQYFPQESAACTDGKCEIKSNGNSFTATRKTLMVPGTGEIALYECTARSPGTQSTQFQATTTKKPLGDNLGEQNYSQLIGRVTTARQAYYALVLFKHPEQLEVVTIKPELVEVGNSFNDPYYSDRQAVLSDPRCAVLREASFTEYPEFKEIQGAFTVKRAWRNGLNYYLEEARVTPDAEVQEYREEKIMGCE